MENFPAINSVLPYETHLFALDLTI